MRIEETFSIDLPPEAVFDYMTDPSSLARWQTSKTYVEPLTEGPPGLGMRVREGTKPPLAKAFDQVVEFTEFDRPRRFHTHIVEGPFPVDGTWSLDPVGSGTRVHFVAEGPLGGVMKLLEPLFERMMAREFAGYHRNLRRNLEGGPGS
jgi:carbon monoxide dehydrogenase subunit G